MNQGMQIHTYVYIYIYPQVYVYILERLGTEDTKTIKDTQIKKNIYI